MPLQSRQSPQMLAQKCNVVILRIKLDGYQRRRNQASCSLSAIADLLVIRAVGSFVV